MGVVVRMEGMVDDQFVETVDPADAFAALADETRVDILRAMWELKGNPSNPRHQHLSFSELRERVGMRDSGQFNYHLDKLTDRFITKSDEGYRLTLAGHLLLGSLVGGAYTREGSIDPIPLDDPCPFCGGDRVFKYGGEFAEFACEECDVGTFFAVPPGVFAGYETDQVPAVAEAYMRTYLQQTAEGFCPMCEGRIQPTVVPSIVISDPEKDVPEDLSDLPAVRYECDRCYHTTQADLGTALLHHPAVVAFHHDNGIDIREAPLGRFVAGDEDSARVLEQDPLRVVVTYEANGERLRVVLDEERTVEEIDRGDR
jgi:DNA-binding transcriptional ArsR family regulator